LSEALVVAVVAVLPAVVVAPGAADPVEGAVVVDEPSATLGAVPADVDEPPTAVVDGVLTPSDVVGPASEVAGPDVAGTEASGPEMAGPAVAGSDVGVCELGAAGTVVAGVGSTDDAGAGTTEVA
jgi:hypothetical protein